MVMRSIMAFDRKHHAIEYIWVVLASIQHSPLDININLGFCVEALPRTCATLDTCWQLGIESVQRGG